MGGFAALRTAAAGNVDVINEWRHGDIVRMGYIPHSLSDGILHRFRFQTDAEGFRNSRVRERFDVAALGDSFTDAMTMAAEASWPAELEQRLGASVQNYGTAGFGPRQERLVLQDVVAPHRPRLVVWRLSPATTCSTPKPSTPFNVPVSTHGRCRDGASSRWSAAPTRGSSRAPCGRAAAGFGQPHDAPLAAAENHGAPRSCGARPLHSIAECSVPVDDRAVRSRSCPVSQHPEFLGAELGARRGWALTAAAIRDMRDVSRSFGADFVVLFIPFKSQVYLPLVEHAFTTAQLRAFTSTSTSTNGLSISRSCTATGSPRTA
jgi:hypothetical protein